MDGYDFRRRCYRNKLTSVVKMVSCKNIKKVLTKSGLGVRLKIRRKTMDYSQFKPIKPTILRNPETIAYFCKFQMNPPTEEQKEAARKSVEQYSRFWEELNNEQN